MRTLVTIIALAATVARADEPAPDDALVEARQRFLDGAALVQKAQWAEALAAFEQSAKLRPHAVTTYNIGACQRAMGQYTRARLTLARALDEDRAGAGQLSESLRTEAQAYLAQIDRLLVRVRVRIQPEGAAIAVDGRPVSGAGAAAGTETESGAPTLIAGILPPGTGEAAPSDFLLVADPGAHVITLSRKGFTDAVVNRTWPPGAQTELALELDRLPATLHISSDREGALVTVDGADVGPAPVDVLRPAGAHKVSVKKKTFVPYEARVDVKPGESVDLKAALAPEKTSLLKRWWFWGAIAVGLVAVGVGAFYAAGGPQRPPLDGGSLGWTLDVSK